MDAIFLLFSVIAIILVFSLFFYFIPVGLWISALAARVHIGIGELIGMRLRRVPPRTILGSQINATKAGLEIPTAFLEAHYLAGGHVENVVNALIAADKAGLVSRANAPPPLTWPGAMCSKPCRSASIPKSFPPLWSPAVAKDGIQVKATSRVTVRANIERLVGGAGRRNHYGARGRGHCHHHRAPRKPTKMCSKIPI